MSFLINEPSGRGEGKKRNEARAAKVHRGLADAYFEFSAASFSSLSSLGGGESSNDKMNLKPLGGRRLVLGAERGPCLGFVYLFICLFPKGGGSEGEKERLQGTHLMMHSGIWMFSMGMSFSSSSKLATYFILLLNLALRQEKHTRTRARTHPRTHTHSRTGPSDNKVRVSGSVSQKMLPGLFISWKENFGGLTLRRWAN